MKACCCSLAGTDACKYCQNNGMPRIGQPYQPSPVDIFEIKLPTPYPYQDWTGKTLWQGYRDGDLTLIELLEHMERFNL
jgi:hypothetical protein